MKVHLIAPAKEHVRVTREGEKPVNSKMFRFSLLSLLSVAACTPDDIEITITDEQVEPVIFDEPFDLVGITFMTALASRAYELASEYRKRGVPVVFGGYHTSLHAKEALRHCDAVCIGEAESTWPRLIDDYTSGRIERVYQSNTPADLSTLKWPRHDLIKKRHYITVNAVQAGRGCPNSCEFCSVAAFFHNRYRHRPVRDVIAEISSLKEKFFVFVDDNITAEPEYAKELFRRLEPLKKRWISQASITAADDDELIRLAARSGCKGLFVGIETLSEKNLNSLNKGFNDTNSYLHSIDRMRDNGIGVEAGIIFGMDDDDVGVFERTLDFCERAKIDAVQASILTPLPGTALYERYRAQDRIIDTDWSHYDYRHVVFKPRLMAPEQLQDGADWFIQQFYGTGSIAKRAMKAAFQLGPLGSLLFALPLNIAYHTGSRKWVGTGRNPARDTTPRRFLSRGSTALLEWPVVSPIRDALYCTPGAGTATITRSWRSEND